MTGLYQQFGTSVADTNSPERNPWCHTLRPAKVRYGRAYRGPEVSVVLSSLFLAGWPLILAESPVIPRRTSLRPQQQSSAANQRIPELIRCEFSRFQRI